jgi:S-(hydroxymethyl)glutathione dehydrogenase / alcohol dehydrogenase
MELTVPVLRQARVPMAMERVVLEEPQRGEVRVRMVASGVCHSCLHAADGSHGGIPLPMILGDEGAGVVDAVGPGVESVRPGDHVVISWAPGCGACRQCLIGRPARCTRKLPFGYADATTTRFHDASGADVFHYGPATYAPQIVVPAAAAVVVRPEIPLEVAALIGCCVMTGVGAVVNTARVGAGESAAVFGCGGVGLNAVQGAAMSGAYPIVAVDVVASKLDFARQMGATHVVDARAEDPVAALRGLLGDGVDHAFVAVGAARPVEQAIAALAPGGTCVIIGAPPTSEQIVLDSAAVRAGECRVIGSSYGSANPPVDFPHLVELYLAGRLRLDELVTRRYDLDQANEAFEHLAAGDDARGLIVF